MPWAPNDAESHTAEADSPQARRLWADVADKELEQGKDEGNAIKIANGVVKKRKEKNIGKAFRELIRLAKSDALPYVRVHNGSCLEMIARSMDYECEDEEKGIGAELAPSKTVRVRQHARVNQNKQQISPVRSFNKRKFDI
jgi:hypothetical protein